MFIFQMSKSKRNINYLFNFVFQLISAFLFCFFYNPMLILKREPLTPLGEKNSRELEQVIGAFIMIDLSSG